jgi:hypothetical protein
MSEGAAARNHPNALAAKAWACGGAAARAQLFCGGSPFRL